MKKKIFKLTARELKVLRGGKQTAGGNCNGLSDSGTWASSAARKGPGRGKPKVAPVKPRAAVKK